jgi:hypothetical protein
METPSEPEANTTAQSNAIAETLFKFQFDAFARTPLMWRTFAATLRTSALAILNIALQMPEKDRRPVAGNPSAGTQPDQGYIGVFRMLYGYALEDLAKGILMGREKKKVWCLSKDLKSHRLTSLVERCTEEEPLNKPDGDILDLLTDHIVWQGRYPIPLSWEHVGDKAETPSTWFQLPPAFGKGELDTLEVLYTRLDASLVSETPVPTFPTGYTESDFPDQPAMRDADDDRAI